MKNYYNFVPWWYCIWPVHAFFVLLLYFWRLDSTPIWFKASVPSVSLAHENNYAVWWSGICLLVASLIFYRIGSLKQLDSKESMVWYILALLVLALSIDEIGSLHERVSLVYGWLGLLPFALVFGLAFGYSIVQLLKRSETRLTAILVLFAISLFVGVAGLEFVEHNIHFDSYTMKTFRLLAEEGTELIGVSLLVIGGLVTMGRYGIEDRRLRVLVGNFTGFTIYREVIFLFLIIHMVAILTFFIPNGYGLRRGNPASIFPIYLFFITAITCFYQAGRPGAASYFRPMGIILLLTSLSQTYNFNRLVNNLLTLDSKWFTAAPGSWLATLIPLFMMSYWLWKSNHIESRKVGACALVILGVLLLVYPGMQQTMLYFLYSGCVAYACFWLLAVSSIPSRDDDSPLKKTISNLP